MLEAQPASNLTIIRHPVVQVKLTLARDKRTTVEQFRNLVRQISRLMAFELTREFPVKDLEVETPLGPCRGWAMSRGLTLIPILRAGLGMIDGILELFPAARVGHLGIYRDEETLKPVVYYSKLPQSIAETDVIVIDPMLATAGSVNAAIDEIKKRGAMSIRLLCLVASPEGVRALNARHRDVWIYTAAVDERLDKRGYIVPGLGDAGDRLFGTA